MPLFGNRILETTTSTGTGDIVLDGRVADAVVGNFLPFNSQFSAGQPVTYFEFDTDDPVNLEVGKGTFQTGPDRIVKSSLLYSTTGALIVWSAGTKMVGCAPAAEQLASLLTTGVGFLVNTSGETYARRVISLGAGPILGSNLNGVSGDPTLDQSDVPGLSDANTFTAKQIVDEDLDITGLLDLQGQTVRWSGMSGSPVKGYLDFGSGDRVLEVQRSSINSYLLRHNYGGTMYQLLSELSLPLPTLVTDEGKSLRATITGSYELIDATVEKLIGTDSLTGTEVDIAIPASFEELRVEIIGALPTTDNRDLLMRLSIDGGSTFKQGASDYEWSYSARRPGADLGDGDADDTEIELFRALTNSVASPRLVMHLYPGDGSLSAYMDWEGTMKMTTGVSVANLQGAAIFQGFTSRPDYLRLFLSSSDSFAGGTVRMYSVERPT